MCLNQLSFDRHQSIVTVVLKGCELVVGQVLCDYVVQLIPNDIAALVMVEPGQGLVLHLDVLVLSVHVFEVIAMSHRSQPPISRLSCRDLCIDVLDAPLCELLSQL